MLTLLLGTDWAANQSTILRMISQDVAAQKSGRILIVPELISHDTERKLCAAAGDTASRFAEVLTFTRLAKRVSDGAGLGAPECLDNGGRLVAMASATLQLHSKLKAYAALETRPEFLTGLLDAVDEFKRCCISAEDLRNASLRSYGSLAQKLEELSLILEAYDGLCAQGKRDPRDQMTWLLEQLEDSQFAAEHTFYIDGFPDFTRQHTAILKHLIAESANVVISLNCDRTDSDDPAFEKAGQTAGELLRIARELAVETNILQIPVEESNLSKVRAKLFAGTIETDPDLTDSLQVYRTESVYQECHLAAEEIVKLVQNGCRYRNISVVCTDMPTYENTLGMVFSRYNIPVYVSGTEDILDKTVITTVLSAIDAAIGGFEQAEVIRYLRSSLSPLQLEDCDQIENYAITWNINGNRWCTDWEYHPGGLGAAWTEGDREYLARLNALRDMALAPLIRLRKSIKEAVSVGQIVDAIYGFFGDIQLEDRLMSLAAHMARSGDLRGEQVLSQLWEILLSALEQLSDMLGATHWDGQNFTKLLKLLLSQYDVGTIPAVLDAVTVGPVSAMRCQQSEHLLLLGASEGRFPAYSGSAGILTDQERTQLRQLGVPLTGGAMEGLQAEYSDIYGVFCGAKKTITVSCPGEQPSFLYQRLGKMVSGETRRMPLGVAHRNAMEAAAYLIRTGNGKEAEFLGIAEAYYKLRDHKDHKLGAVAPETIEKLYGKTIKLSASQVDKLADCRLAYYLQYGLKLKERKQATIDPMEFGTYVHAVLEQTARKIMDLGGFHEVSLEQTLQIANEFSQRYILERFRQIDSQRVSYLFRRNAHELEMVVTELWDELRESAFSPAEFELAFGMGGPMDAITVSGKNLSARLRGFVDRVDIWRENEQTYYRVVDYKTGKKDFDYCDVYNGLGLQMLLYLFALEDNAEYLLGEHPVGAGVQYFPARAPVVAAEGRLTDEEACQARQKVWKREGILLRDDVVLQAMEPGEKPKRLPYSVKKDGTVSGDLADRQQMGLLKSYVFLLLSKMVDDIATGCVDPNPYTRGSRHNACAFCPYGTICHNTTVQDRRDYAAMSQDDFWKNVEKEVSRNA